MRLKNFLIMGLLVWTLSVNTEAEAFIMINEILADPPAGLAGDANADGVGSTSDDEFIELYNSSQFTIDMSNWYLSDSLKIRHIFGAGRKLPAGNYLLVFGGGSPDLSGIDWEIASNGALGLNNSGDTVTLYNALDQVVQQVIYGSEAGHDQSIVRNPEGSTGAFIQHSDLINAHGAIYSPGYFVNEAQSTTKGTATSAAIPEASTLLLLGFGSVAALLKRCS